MAMAANDVKWLQRCATGACVEVGRHDDLIVVRDSKEPDGPMMAFSRAAWAEFVAGVREGQFRH